MSYRLGLTVLLLAASLWGQSGSSTILGTIKDPTGAPLPNAKLRIANTETGVAIETTANDEGLYRAPSLVPGSYRLDVEASGFEKQSRGPLDLAVGEVRTLDVTLRVGPQSETVDVVEAAPVIESQSSNVSQAVTRQMLTGLPLPNRAASSLVALAPGVVMVDSGVGTAENYPVFTVAGGRTRNQNFTLDGGNVSNAVGLTRPQQLTTLPVDAMQEFRVISNNYSAEFGHSTGGIVTMSTRAGTNEYHGSLFESLKNTALDARNFFAATRPPVRLNQFGASFGGPIKKDRTHFFVSWEQTRQLTSEAIVSTVPNQALRGGDFSGLRNAAGGIVPVYDPASTAGTTRTQFPGNVIPNSRLDPVAIAALGYYPLPNRVGTATGGNNFVGNSTSSLDRKIVVGRVDHQLRPSDLLTARYYINDSGTNTSGSYGIPVADPTADLTDVRVQSILVAHTHIFRPNLILETRGTYLQRKFIDTRPGLGEDYAAKIGLKNVSNAAFPAFTLPGYATLGNATAVSRFQTPIKDTQILSALSWFQGRHAFKVGGEFRRGGNDEIRDRGSAGVFGISPLITSLPGFASTGNSVASLLLGEVNSANIQVSDLIRTRAAYVSFYAQDDWRITDRLTLNYGLRWEAELPRREVDNKQNSFDPLAINPVSGTPGVVTFSGVNGTPERAFRTDRNNIGPRVGFAYRVHGLKDTVVRGGAGIFYGPTVSNTIGDTASLGFSTNASFVVPQAEFFSALRLRDGVPAYTRPALSPAFGAVAPGQRPNTAISYFNPNQLAPTSYQYNLSVQREFARGSVVELGYIGNVSHHLTGNDFTLNQVRPERMGAGDAQARRPFPQFSNVTWINPSIGNSTYHGGFVRAERRFSGGLAFLAHYTWSKFIDDMESANEYGSVGSYMDAYNRRLDKGLSGSDVPHRVVITALYQLPRLRNHSALVRAAAAEWKFGLLETFQSGPPFTVVSNVNTTNAFPAGPMRPNILRDATLSSDQRSLSRWFDTAAFVNPAQFTFGNSPRSALRGPGVLTTDVTLEKSFHASERYSFDIRAEAYNLLNKANFLLPGSTLGTPDFGVISAARPARTLQLAARLSF